MCKGKRLPALGKGRCLAAEALTIYSARNLNYSLGFCTALAVFSGPFPRLRFLLGEVLQLIEQES